MKQTIKIITLIILSKALTFCAPLPEKMAYGLKVSTPFTSEDIYLLEAEYKTLFPTVNLSGLEYYETPAEEINGNVCGSFDDGYVYAGCIFTGHDIVFISSDFSDPVQDCHVIAHEMMHEILDETTGSPDPEHNHKNWQRITRTICDGLGE